MPTIPEYEIYAMKYAERQTDLPTFVLGVEPGRETIVSTTSSGFCRGELSRLSSIPALHHAQCGPRLFEIREAGWKGGRLGEKKHRRCQSFILPLFHDLP